MSKITEEKEYIFLLTNKRTSDEQRGCLLVTCSNKQLKALSVVFKNILKPTIPLPYDVKKKIKSKKKLFLKLSGGSTSVSDKKKLLEKNIDFLCKILKSTHKLLLGVLT